MKCPDCGRTMIVMRRRFRFFAVEWGCPNPDCVYIKGFPNWRVYYAIYSIKLRKIRKVFRRCQ